MSYNPFNFSRNLHKSYSAIQALQIGLFVFLFSGFTYWDSKKNYDPVIKNDWVGTWSTALQLVEPHNMPPAPGLTNNTLRQVVRVSIGGDSLKVRFSNEFSTNAVIMKTVQIAVSAGGSVIDSSTIKVLKFNGSEEVTMDPGIAITCDPFAFSLTPRMDVAITIFFGQTSADVTGHPGSRTTSYILAGENTMSAHFESAIKTDHWYIINGIDVKAPENAGAVAIIGNSITDGRGSGTNKQNRWPDILSERLLKNPGTQNIGVLNLGIGGNCVLRQCLGQAALDRFNRDVLKQQGVKWLIIMEGINDIGQSPDSAAALKVAGDLIAAYEKMINDAQANNIKVYGATLTPIAKSFYYTPFHEAARTKVNEWIRTSGKFDAVIDFDKVLVNPEDGMSILPEAHSGDFLHPNETGYKMMGEAVDPGLFEK